jgi:SAM-dependent methyltransferase
MQFYARFYEAELPEHEIASMGHRELPEYAKIFFEQVPQHQGRLLDVGCGEGAFLSRAKAVGFETTGIDLDEKAVWAVKRLRGLQDVQVSYLADFVSPEAHVKNGFDIITIFEVLEHQADLKTFMVDIKHCLKRKGRIFGTVPNRDRYFPNLHQKGVLGDYPPAHFTRWSKKALKMFLIGQGFQKIDIIQLGFNNLWDVSKRASARLLGGSQKTIFMKLLVLISSVISFPFVMIFFWNYKKRGQQLFFSAEYEGTEEAKGGHAYELDG